jgi:hypothetical protein
METITITFDRTGNTLDIWLDKLRPCISEEKGKGLIIKKDEQGNIIGFEKLNYLKKAGLKDVHTISLEVGIY